MSLVDRQHYTALLAVARRHARRKDGAEDVLQNAMLVAIAKGRADVTKVENRRWLCGIIKNLAAFEARGAARRRLREQRWFTVCETASPPANLYARMAVQDFADSLPPRLRTAAHLALSGHTRIEIAHLLRVSDMAVRQYVSGIRRRWREQSGETEVDMFGLSGALAYGRIRQRLRIHLARVPQAVLASHDPDGHVFSVTTYSQNDS